MVAGPNRSGTGDTACRRHVPIGSKVPAGSASNPPAVDGPDNRVQITKIATTQAPELLDLPGVGAITAAVVLTIWSYLGQIRS
jgi:hypothetical protein